MHATHPRNSILNLFDPLSFPVPSRDDPTPDSDKENLIPTPNYDYFMTDAFFGRTLKQPSPVLLKRRLVDVGDVTVDDPSMLAMLTEEEELDESMCDDDNDTLTLPRLPPATPARVVLVQPEHATPTNSCPRTPLGEIVIDRDITPIARTKIYRRLAPSALSSETVLLASSDGSSIASVINAVNASGASFATQALINPSVKHDDLIHEDNPSNKKPHNIETPHIIISSVDGLSDSLSTLNLDTPTGTPLIDVSRPFASTPSESSDGSPPHLRTGLRPNPPKTSSQDPNRCSIDLHSSFRLQLQSEEASFDLLNDKISFFASTNGTDSFLIGMGEDDSFDMVVEETKLQRAIETIQEEEIQEKASKESFEDIIPGIKYPELDENIASTSNPTSIDTATSTKDSTSGTSASPLRNSSRPNSPASPTFLFGQCKHPAKMSTPLEEPTVSSSAIAPIFVPAPEQHAVSYSGVHTPAPLVREAVPPLPVPALRIVKRAQRFGHEKTSSSSSASSTEATSAPREALEARPIPIQTFTVPPPRLMSTLTSVAGAGRIGGPSRVVAPAPAAALPSARIGTGPRRVPIVDSYPNSRTVSGNQKPPANTTGPRRVIVNAPPVAVAPKVPAISGLKAPTKYRTAASALPRPVSRLPASPASGLVRPRPTIGNGLGSGTGQGNVGRAVSSRRVAYGG